MAVESVKVHGKFDGVYSIKAGGLETYATVSASPGTSVYGERLFAHADGAEYREWNPYRSKLCAYLKKGGKDWFFTTNSNILYLGAANGTTVSHLADAVPGGRIYAIEFSARSLRELVQRLASRKNVVPMLADATQPGRYRALIPEQVDVIYQDVAQPDQSHLLVENIIRFLKPGGHFYITIKSRSIDVSMPPEVVFQRERSFLERKGCVVLDQRDISPYSEDHVMIVGQVG